MRPNDNVATVDTRDVQDDPVLVSIVDNTPGIACIGMAAFKFPMFSLATECFKAVDFGAFAISPICSGRRSHSFHTAKTWIGFASSKLPVNRETLKAECCGMHRFATRMKAGA